MPDGFRHHAAGLRVADPEAGGRLSNIIPPEEAEVVLASVRVAWKQV
jgi:hypothetical protein